MPHHQTSNVLRTSIGLLLLGTSLASLARAQSADAALFSFTRPITNGAIHLYTIDPTDGTDAPLLPIDSSSYPTYAAFDEPEGLLYVFGHDDQLVTVDLSDGSVTPITTLQLPGFLSGMAFAPDGSLRIASGSTLYQVDPATGQTLGSLTMTHPVRALGGNGERLIGVGDYDNGTWTLDEIDPDTGDITVLSPLPIDGSCPSDADLDRRGQFWLVTNHCPGQLLIFKSISRIEDFDSGQFIPVGAWGAGNREMGFMALAVSIPLGSVEIPAVEELGILWLVLTLAAAGLWSLRRARSA
ncbi:MAG: hypothetical protein K8J08_10875 [Thermoanaerobaculia bacterium]|nr:hypothetical protein [Thermoanaerobaculia bacterium]